MILTLKMNSEELAKVVSAHLPQVRKYDDIT